MTIARFCFFHHRRLGLIAGLMVFVVGLAAPYVANAQVAPQGDEFQVNETTSGHQRNFGSRAIASASDGRFLIVWGDYSASGQGSEIFGRAYDPAGVPLGTEFRVNSYTTNDQRTPAIARLGSGDFVVVWRSDRSGIHARRFDVSGMPVDANDAVLATFLSPNAGNDPSVAGSGSGFVATWTDYDASQAGVYAQKFDVDSTPLGTAFVVNETEERSQYRSMVTQIDVAGSTAVVWRFNGPGGDNDRHVFGRVLDPTGTPSSSEFQINTYTTGRQLEPAVASSGDGTFVVVWNHLDGKVSAQRFAATGAMVGTEIDVRGQSTPIRTNADVVVDSNNRFLVLWDTSVTSAQPREVQARAFDAQGGAIGRAFQINTYTSGGQYQSSASVAADGTFTVAWTSNDYFSFVTQDGDRAGMFAQRLRIDALCGDPSSDRSVLASDALLGLQAAVGQDSCALCVCDPNNDSAVTATDALIILQSAVGQQVVLGCPVC